MREWQDKMPQLRRLILKRFVSSLEGMAAERAGEVLNVISGRLRGSIFGNVIADDEAEVRAGSNVVYAAIHEFGGTITPKTGKYLRFKNQDGREVFVRSVEIPARPYVKPSIEEFFRGGTHTQVANGAFREHKRRYGFE
jgi:phage gpG-like protein